MQNKQSCDCNTFIAALHLYPDEHLVLCFSTFKETIQTKVEFKKGLTTGFCNSCHFGVLNAKNGANLFYILKYSVNIMDDLLRFLKHINPQWISDKTVVFNNHPLYAIPQGRIFFLDLPKEIY